MSIGWGQLGDMDIENTFKPENIRCASAFVKSMLVTSLDCIIVEQEKHMEKINQTLEKPVVG